MNKLNLTFSEVDITAPETTFADEATTAAEETYAPEETIVKETEPLTDSAPILTIGGIDGETALLMAGTTEATETSAAIGFEPMNFVNNLQYMGTGMLTIFIVIGAIILATTAINKIFSKK